jgi:ribonucleoside-triphosphate reductase
VLVQTPEDMKYLFTTKTCPNCKLAKEYLKNEKYIVIDAEENMELVSKYGVMQAPTLVVVNGDHSEKYVNASNIKRYAETEQLVPV